MKLKIALPMLLLLSCGQGNNQTKNTQQLEFQTKNTSEENKKDPQEIKSQRLKEAFENKNEALFLVEFPSDFYQFMEYFGWYDENAQPNELYEESYAYIDYFFDLMLKEQHKKLEVKMIRIAENGRWQEDGVNYFQDKTLDYIKNEKRHEIINTLSSVEAQSVLFFLFDGPHPKFDTDFASHLSPSKKEILKELFETGFYDHHENPDPIMPDLEEVDPIDDEGSIHYDISDFEGAEHFFIRDIDINNDGVLDKIVSADPYQGDELFLFENVGGEYQHSLKTTNFSEDGGNQIVDVIAENGGFFIKTAFPDRGLLEAYHHITFKDPNWVLTNTVYRTQSSNQVDPFIYVCDLVQGLYLDDTNILQKLKWLPDEADRKRSCTKEIK